MGEDKTAEKKPMPFATNIEELKALADGSVPFKVGDKDYTLYPVSLGKIALLTEPFTKVLPVIEKLRNVDQDKMDELVPSVLAVIDDVINTFVIITYPNDGTEPKVDLTDEDRKSLGFQLTIGKIIQLFMLLKDMAIFEGMIKNLNAPLKANPLSGAGLSEQSSE